MIESVNQSPPRRSPARPLERRGCECCGRPIAAEACTAIEPDDEPPPPRPDDPAGLAVDPIEEASR